MFEPSQSFAGTTSLTFMKMKIINGKKQPAKKRDESSDESSEDSSEEESSVRRLYDMSDYSFRCRVLH